MVLASTNRPDILHPALMCLAGSTSRFTLAPWHQRQVFHLQGAPAPTEIRQEPQNGALGEEARSTHSWLHSENTGVDHPDFVFFSSTTFNAEVEKLIFVWNSGPLNTQNHLVKEQSGDSHFSTLELSTGSSKHHWLQAQPQT